MLLESSDIYSGRVLQRETGNTHKSGCSRSVVICRNIEREGARAVERKEFGIDEVVEGKVVLLILRHVTLQ